MMSKTLNVKKLTFFLGALLILVCLSVMLDILVLRQLLSFIFLTFIPGSLILLILKLDKLRTIEKSFFVSALALLSYYYSEY